MSSSKKGDKKPLAVQFEDIVNFVTAFEYDAENKVENGDAKKAEGASKPKNQNAIRKANLTNLVASVLKIKGSVFTDKMKQKADVENLYKLVAEKLGDDLYKFNVSICIKFLAGYNSKSAGKTDAAIKYLYDCILLNATEKICSWQLDIKPAAFIALFENDVFALSASVKDSLINAVKKICGGEKAIAVKEQVISTIYLALMLSGLNRFSFDNYLVVIERTIAEFLSEMEQRELSKYTHKFVPEALLDINPKIKIRSNIFLYLGITDALVEQKKRGDKLAQELSESQAKAYTLSSEVRNLTASGEQKDKTILAREGEIAKLGEELSATRDRLEFEVNMYERQLSGLKTGIYSKIKQDLQLELEGISNLANKLPSKESDDLQLWLANIKQLISGIGGKN